MEENVSKFGQNYKFREVFFKKGAFLFSGVGTKFKTCRGNISSGRGKAGLGGAPPAPVEDSQSIYIPFLIYNNL